MGRLTISWTSQRNFGVYGLVADSSSLRMVMIVEVRFIVEAISYRSNFAANRFHAASYSPFCVTC